MGLMGVAARFSDAVDSALASCERMDYSTARLGAILRPGADALGAQLRKFVGDRKKMRSIDAVWW